MFSFLKQLFLIGWIFDVILWIGRPYKDYNRYADSKADHYAKRAGIILASLFAIFVFVTFSVFSYGILPLALLTIAFVLDACLVLCRLYYVQTQIREAKGSGLPVPVDIWKDDD